MRVPEYVYSCIFMYVYIHVCVHLSMYIEYVYTGHALSPIGGVPQLALAFGIFLGKLETLHKILHVLHLVVPVSHAP